MKWDVAQSAAAGLQLLSAGKVDMSQGSAPTAYAAAKLDPDLRVIGFLNGPAYLMVAPEGSGIETAADLKGKTVGVLALGSASDLMVRGSLAEAGLDPDKDRQDPADRRRRPHGRGPQLRHRRRDRGLGRHVAEHLRAHRQAARPARGQHVRPARA